jgi:hypothetical protein
MANAIINVGQTGGQVNISTAAAPATPAAGVVTLYAGTDKALHALNSDGLDITLGAGGAASPITEEQTNTLVSTGVGATAGAGANCSVAIGYFAINNAVCSVAVGVSTICSGSDNSTAIGGIGARVGNSAQCGIAISGCIAVVCSTGGIAIGSNTVIKNSSANSTIIGNSSNVFAGATGTVVLGNSSVGGTGACNSVVIGNSAQTTGACSVVIGQAACSPSSNQIIIGSSASSSASGQGNIVIGVGACGRGTDGVYPERASLTIGTNADACQSAIAIGQNAKAQGQTSIVIGEACTTGNAAIAMGRVSCASADFAHAIGYAAFASANCSQAFGLYACSTAGSAIAVGYASTASHAGSVALGPNIATEKTNTTHVQSLIAYGQAASKTNAIGSTGGSVTINWDNSNIQTLTLDSDISTLTKSNPIDGAVYTLFITQGGTGGKTVSWGSDVEWPGGTPPTLSTAAGAVDAVSLVYIAGVTGYYGNSNLNFS